jgi:FkbM family methyltransferase
VIGLLRHATVRARTDIGKLLLHADDKVMTPFIGEHGRWEPDEADWMRQALRPGATMVDVGANVGYFTVLASQAVGEHGRVVAVEPERRNLRLLARNVRANRCRNVRVIRAAAWETAGMLTLRRNPDNAGDHQTHPDEGGELVSAVALDDVLEGPVDVVKIDTQGADHYVIAGLSRTLEANPHATVLVEFWLDAMAERGLSALGVLARYRALGRPVMLLDRPDVPATDAQVIAAARARPDHWANLIIGPRESQPIAVGVR